MLIFLNWKSSLSMLRCISLHAHVYKLMLCIVFMEVSSGQLTKYISGGEPFPTGCLMDNLIYFLNSNAGCSTTFIHAVAAPRHCHWWVNSLVRFLQNPSEGMWIHASKNKILLTKLMICNAGNLSISWRLLNTFSSIRFKFDSKLS